MTSFAGALESDDRLLLALAGRDEQVAGLGAIEMIQQPRALAENSTALMRVLVGIAKASNTPAIVACTPDSCTKNQRRETKQPDRASAAEREER